MLKRLLYLVSSNQVKRTLPSRQYVSSFLTTKQNIFSISYCTNVKNEVETPPQTSKKTKEQFITLIGADESICFTTLTDATKLSTRRGLKLFKVTDFDKKRQTPVYKLMTGAQYLKEDIEAKKLKAKVKGFKTEKILSFSNKISSHDLTSKIKQMTKWLEKNHEIRVNISGKEGDDKAGDIVFKQIEESLKGVGRFLQKRNSGVDMKFQVIPPKKE